MYIFSEPFLAPPLIGQKWAATVEITKFWFAGSKTYLCRPPSLASRVNIRAETGIAKVVLWAKPPIYASLCSFVRLFNQNFLIMVCNEQPFVEVQQVFVRFVRFIL